MRRKNRRSLRTASPVHRRVFRPELGWLEARTLLSTISWASDVSGDWDNPAMWTGGAVPGPNDDAVIGFSDVTVTHDTSAADIVDSINCSASLDITSGSVTIDTTSPSQPSSTVSGQFNLSNASLELPSGNLSLTGGGTVSGTITAASGTTLSLSGQALTAASSISADVVSLYYVSDAGSYSATSGTTASFSTLTGSVTSVGSYLDVYSFDYSPAAGVAPTTITTGTLSLGGTLSGTGDITVTGLFTWGSASLYGSGTLDALGGIAMDGDVNRYLYGWTLNNYGEADYDAPTHAAVEMEDGAVFDNEPTGTLNIQGPGQAVFYWNPGDDPGAPAPSFYNNGSMISSSGNDVIGVPFTTTGTVHLQQGSLSLGFGGYGLATSTGQIVADPGTTLFLTSMDLDAASSISADVVSLYYVSDAGSYSATSGTTASFSTLTGSVTSVGSYLDVYSFDYSPAAGVAPTTITTGTLSLGGTLSGTGDITVTGLFTWGSASLYGSGTLDALGGIAMDGDVNRYLYGWTLNNYGEADYDAPTHAAVEMEDGAVFDNEPTGTLNIQGPGQAVFYWNPGDDPGAPAPSFYNNGSIISSSGDDVIGVPFTTTGTVHLQQGSLSLGFGGYGLATSTGQIVADPGTTLFLTSMDLDAASSISADVVSLYYVSDAGSYSATSGTTASFSTLTGSVTSVGSYLDVYSFDYSPAAGVAPTTITTGTLSLGGTLSGTGDITVTGLFTWGSASLYGSGTLDALGGIAMDGDVNRYLYGWTLNNYGEADYDAPTHAAVEMEDGAVFDNEPTGTLNIQGPGQAVFYWNPGDDPGAPAPSFYNNGNVNVQLGELGLYTFGTVNSGTVTVSSGTSLDVDSYTQTAGSTVLNGGTINGGTLNINGGSLSGTGTINADVTNAGQVIPGGTGAAGTLTINGNYTQTATGTLDIDIGGTTAGSQYDQLAVSGTRVARRHGQCLPDQRLPARSRQHVPAPDFRLVHRKLRLLQRHRPRQPPAPRSRAESHQPDAHRPAGRHDDDPCRPAFALGLRPERDLHGHGHRRPAADHDRSQSRPAR